MFFDVKHAMLPLWLTLMALISIILVLSVDLDTKQQTDKVNDELVKLVEYLKAMKLDIFGWWSTSQS